jgi:hypothetical protein
MVATTGPEPGPEPDFSAKNRDFRHGDLRPRFT